MKRILACRDRAAVDDRVGTGGNKHPVAAGGDPAIVLQGPVAGGVGDRREAHALGQGGDRAIVDDGGADAGGRHGVAIGPELAAAHDVEILVVAVQVRFGEFDGADDLAGHFSLPFTRCGSGCGRLALFAILARSDNETSV
ncbi:MAG: hypothetical protein IT562_09850 [Alphaproteobacteria bacterium]|nr:hypothetical protein [Alphaproteobacteria bacterium]